MKRFLVAAIAIATLAGSCLTACGQVRTGTDAEITFANDLEKRARDQLRRILSQYDLDSWIFTREVKIEAGAGWRGPGCFQGCCASSPCAASGRTHVSIYLTPGA